MRNEGRSTMNVDKEFLALAYLLQEFGDYDLEERLRSFEQDYEQGDEDAKRSGDELRAAWCCVVDWMAVQGRHGLNMQSREEAHHAL
jgi:hypothetical protein